MAFSQKKCDAEHGLRPKSCQPASARWIDSLLSLLLPQHCAICSSPTEGQRLCQPCHLKLPWLGPQCARCALPLPSGPICGPCLHSPPPQTASWAAFEYGGAVASLLQRLKFSGQLQNAQILGELLLESAPPLEFHTIDCLIPAPLHLRRLRQRGFNQSLELARPLASHHKLDIRRDLLRRERDTEEQSRLPAKARIKNVAGAFRVTESLAGEHILLLDDVMTTGATMRAMAETLLAAGASQVSTLAIARAVTR